MNSCAQICNTLLFSSLFLSFIRNGVSGRVILDSCRPKPKQGATQYLVGYGSLMNSDSKNKTYPNTSGNIPILLKGFARTWNCKGVSSTLSTTYLGAYRDPKFTFNAVIFSLNSNSESDESNVWKAIQDYDKRESFYCRKEVERSDFEILGGPQNSIKEDSQYWIYLTKEEFNAAPSKMYPIVQSYVDVWLTGCLELEEYFGIRNFAEQCVKTTRQWSRNWVNDRIYPRRPFVYQPNAGVIDKLLNSTVHEEFVTLSGSLGSHPIKDQFLYGVGILFVTACSSFQLRSL